MKNVSIIGGGLAGLIAAHQLAKKLIPVTVLERKQYPFHRVCGEYISNETIPFLQSNDLFPKEFNPPGITNFILSSVAGKTTQLSLDLGGFGVSRFAFDHFLYQKCLEAGVSFIVNTEVTQVHFDENKFTITTSSSTHQADVVIGAFGKRSKLDHTLKRNFFSKRSPWVGVKYHVTSDHPGDTIALHNFNGGYCGISNVENNITNLCYLVHRDQVKRAGTIKKLEQTILAENKHLKKIFSESTFLFDAPETINEISFETKEPVLNHILMAGDAAGMITPLCGNGMAMAIHAGKILAEHVVEYCHENKTRAQLEADYAHHWKQLFERRLQTGRLIQNKLFGSAWSSALAIGLAVSSKPLARFIMRNTHGTPF